MLKIAESIIRKIESITLTDYEYGKDGIPLENVESMLEDLLYEVERLEERCKEIEDGYDYF